MTENELRKKVCSVINAWIGGTKGSEIHKDILNTYNTYAPLARGYKVQEKDAYCATTVSAAFIRAGIAEYTGTECSCSYFAMEAQKRGIWVENDAYVPKIGDAVLYDWQDDGAGDNTGAPDHIGIVTQVNGTASFVVTEGNMNGGKVGTRTVQVNGKNIRGFIAPAYAQIAAELTPAQAAPTAKPGTDMTLDQFKKLWYAFRKELQDNDSSNYSAAARAWAVSSGLIQGGDKLPDGQPNYMWEDVPTREQLITVLYRYAQITGAL